MSFLTRVADYYKGLSEPVKRLFYGADKGLGGYFFHDQPGQEKTVSKHLADERNEGKPLGTIGCAVLDLADPGHCDKVKS